MIANLKLVSPVFLPGPDRAWASLMRGFSSGDLWSKLAGTLEHMAYGWLAASIAGDDATTEAVMAEFGVAHVQRGRGRVPVERVVERAHGTHRCKCQCGHHAQQRESRQASAHQ